LRLLAGFGRDFLMAELQHHLEGLLHLATLTSVMTLGYLGVDKVGDSARARLEAEFATKVGELGANIMRADVIQRTALNRLRSIVGEDALKPMCMLFALLAPGLRHDLYDGKGGTRKKIKHACELFFSVHCFLRHWDLRVIAAAAVVCVLKMFYLVWCATYSVGVHEHAILGVIIFDAFVILLVVWAAHGVGTAKQKLIGWQAEFDRWVADYRAQPLNRAAQAAEQPIAPASKA
jgi:hypothetical protein